MKEYEHYYFDFDGTLVNTWKSLIIPFQKGFASAGVTLSEDDVLFCTHMAMVQSCAYYGITDEKKMYEIYRIITEEMAKEEEISKIEIYPETVEVLNHLKKKNKHIGVVSGNSVTHIKRVMNILGLSDYFEFYVGGDSTKLPKPYAEPIEKAMELSSFPPKNSCVYIGDSLQDPECAKNAGIDGILLDRRKEYDDYEGEKIFTLKELL